MITHWGCQDCCSWGLLSDAGIQTLGLDLLEMAPFSMDAQGFWRRREGTTFGRGAVSIPPIVSLCSFSSICQKVSVSLGLGGPRGSLAQPAAA